MTKHSRSGGLPAYEARLGRRAPKGRCRECGKRCGGRRRSWCSQGCVHAYRLRTDSSYMRQQVYLRDQAVCTLCGRDCDAFAERLRPLQYVPRVITGRWVGLREAGHEDVPGHVGWAGSWPSPSRVWAAICLAVEVGVGKEALYRRSWWDMDHARPLSEGGSNVLTNLRTLCVPCHKQQSALGATRRAEAARPKAPAPTDQAQLF